MESGGNISPRIVLLGLTGSGKSSAGNRILGTEEFTVLASPESVTKLCEEKKTKVQGRDITVIDTPGIFGTSLPEKKLKAEIKKCISLSDQGPHVFLLVIKLGRFTEIQKKTVEWIQDNFGKNVLSYTIILFSHSDQLGDRTMEEFLSENCELQHVLEEFGNRYHCFDNSSSGRDNHSQVTQLLVKIDDMVRKNGGRYYTYEMTGDEKKQKAKESKIILIFLFVILMPAVAIALSYLWGGEVLNILYENLKSFSNRIVNFFLSG